MIFRGGRVHVIGGGYRNPIQKDRVSLQTSFLCFLITENQVKNACGLKPHRYCADMTSQYIKTDVVSFNGQGKEISLKTNFNDRESMYSSVVLYLISLLIVLHIEIYEVSLLVKLWYFHIIVYIIMVRQESKNKSVAYKYDSSKLSGKNNYDKYSLSSSYETLVNSVVSKGHYTLQASTINEIVNNAQDENKARIGDKSNMNPSIIKLDSIEYVSASKIDINIGEARIFVRKIDEYEHIKDDSEELLGRVASYRIRLTYNGCRWYVWRTYKEVEEAHKKVVITYPLVAVPRLVPIILSKKTSMSQNLLENASKLIIEVGSKFSVDANRLSAEQILMTTWLHQVQRNPMLANNIVLRTFLNMPVYKDKFEYTAISKTISTEKTDNFDHDEEADSITLSEKIKRGWSGNKLNTFKFLNVSPAARGLYLDCSQKHNFKVRGASFLSDKNKIDAGTPLCKLIMMELFEVEPRHGDRIDHIASKGKAKERVEILTNLEDKPSVLVLNLQIPGDPPVCIVAYFALPSNYKEKLMDDADDSNVSYCKLVEKFFDIPMTEKNRLAEWGISDEGDDAENEDGDEMKTLKVGDNGEESTSALSSQATAKQNSSLESCNENESGSMRKKKDILLRKLIQRGRVIFRGHLRVSLGHCH